MRRKKPTKHEEQEISVFTHTGKVHDERKVRNEHDMNGEKILAEIL